MRNARKRPAPRARRERGTAMIVAILIMSLLVGIVAASLSRITKESLVMANDYANTETFYAAQASLELMSRNFNNIFLTKLNPTTDDITDLQNAKPTGTNGVTGAGDQSFDWVQTAVQTTSNQKATIANGPYKNLDAERDAWTLTTTATGWNGSQVQLTKTFYNYRVPIFQFGIFYDSDMEFHPGPNFAFGGRVHSNGNIFLMVGSGATLTFASPITAVGEIVRDRARNNALRSGNWDGTVNVTTGSGTASLTQGSVTDGPDTDGSTASKPIPEPTGTVNTGWASFKLTFNGNIEEHAPLLQLPLQLGTTGGVANNPIELIKRGKGTDDAVLAPSRYYNKACIRITLDDLQSRLPGGAGGVRLDGAADGSSADVDPTGSGTPGDRGYQPVAMLGGGGTARRVNGWRFFTGPTYGGGNRQTWIKVELVQPNVDNLTTPYTTDVTQSFLSLGLTDETDPMNGIAGGAKLTDRAIIKLQRFYVPGRTDAAGNGRLEHVISTGTDAGGGSRPNYSYYEDLASGTKAAINYVNPATDVRVSTFESNASHKVLTSAPGGSTYLVPIPIEMFDSREGLSSETTTDAALQTLYGTPSGASPPTNTTATVPYNGVMSVVDIDVGNLKQLVSGNFNSYLPSSGTNKLQGGSMATITLANGKDAFANGNIPNAGGAGTILYISDRRGDQDNDGEYDMENVYTSNADEGAVGGTSATKQTPEDVNLNGTLQTDFTWEAAPYYTASPNAKNSADAPGVVALRDHKQYRRAVRLTDGATLPGVPFSTWNALADPKPEQEGFTLATENGAYVQGLYNQPTNLTVHGTPSQPSDYNLNTEVPASIAADAVTILSDAWNDGESFRWPFHADQHPPVETTVRAAFLVGRAISSLPTTPSQNSGKEANLSGGVHNFPRFLENWGTYVNYCGSLINLYYSRNNNGTYKNGNAHVYNAPTRNWVFDVSFQNLRRLPPGTPYFQFVEQSGFRQTFRQT